MQSILEEIKEKHFNYYISYIYGEEWDLSERGFWVPSYLPKLNQSFSFIVTFLIYYKLTAIKSQRQEARNPLP